MMLHYKTVITSLKAQAWKTTIVAILTILVYLLIRSIETSQSWVTGLFALALLLLSLHEWRKYFTALANYQSEGSKLFNKPKNW